MLRNLTSTSVYLAMNGSMAIIFSSFLYHKDTDLKILLMAFLITLAVYNLNKATDIVEDSINRPETASRRRIYLASSISAFLFSLYLGASTGYSAIVILLAPFVVGITYSVKIFRSIPRLKNIVGVKSLLVAFTWGLTGSLLPIMNQAMEPEKIVLVFTYIFIQILVNTVIFDVLDMSGDKASGVRTIPIAFGIKKTGYFLGAINSLMLPWIIYSYLRGQFNDHIPALALGIFNNYLFLWFFLKNRSRRITVELTVDGAWIPIVVEMKFGIINSVYKLLFGVLKIL